MENKYKIMIGIGLVLIGLFTYWWYFTPQVLKGTSRYEDWKKHDSQGRYIDNKNTQKDNPNSGVPVKVG